MYKMQNKNMKYVTLKSTPNISQAITPLTHLLNSFVKIKINKKFVSINFVQIIGM